MKVLLCLVFFVFGANLASAKVFKKCELARELSKQGIARSKIPDWVCLAQSESNYNSAAKGPKNKNGSYDWGIFQINDRYWCNVGSKGKDCKANCKDFVNNSIVDDITCAKKIFARHGFNAWYGWIAKCKGKKLPSVNECF